MNTERISLRYARALLDAAKPNNLVETAFNDLEKVGATIASSRELQNLIKSPIVKAYHKKNIFKELFSSKIHELTFNFLNLLIDKNREILIPDIIKQFRKIYYHENGILEVEITTANEIEDGIRQKIEKKLSETFNLKILSNYKIDKSLKGGIKIKVEDVIYDASVSTMLNKLYNKLVSEN